MPQTPHARAAAALKNLALDPDASKHAVELLAAAYAELGDARRALNREQLRGTRDQATADQAAESKLVETLRAKWAPSATLAEFLAGPGAFDTTDALRTTFARLFPDEPVRDNQDIIQRMEAEVETLRHDAAARRDRAEGVYVTTFDYPQESAEMARTFFRIQTVDGNGKVDTVTLLRGEADEVISRLRLLGVGIGK